MPRVRRLGGAALPAHRELRTYPWSPAAPDGIIDTAVMMDSVGTSAALIGEADGFDAKHRNLRIVPQSDNGEFAALPQGGFEPRERP